MPDASLSELLWLLLAVIAAGIVTGLLAGMFGIGGGAVIVPVLFEIFQLFGVPDAVRMQLCIGTSLAIILPTAWRSYRAHHARGMVIPEVLRIWTLPVIAGVAVGSAIAAFALRAIFFKVAFILIAALIITKMLFLSDRWLIADGLPGRPAMIGYGLAIGLGSSLMERISGGSLATMGADAVWQTDPQRRSRPSAGIGVPISIAGTLGYIAKRDSRIFPGVQIAASIAWLRVVG